MRRVCEVESEGTKAKERAKAEKLITLSGKTREKKSSIFDADLVLLLVGIHRCIHRILHTLEVVVHLEKGILLHRVRELKREVVCNLLEVGEVCNPREGREACNR